MGTNIVPIDKSMAVSVEKPKTVSVEHRTADDVTRTSRFATTFSLDGIFAKAIIGLLVVVLLAVAVGGILLLAALGGSWGWIFANSDLGGTVVGVVRRSAYQVDVTDLRTRMEASMITVGCIGAGLAVLLEAMSMAVVGFFWFVGARKPHDLHPSLVALLATLILFTLVLGFTALSVQPQPHQYDVIAIVTDADMSWTNDSLQAATSVSPRPVVDGLGSHQRTNATATLLRNSIISRLPMPQPSSCTAMLDPSSTVLNDASRMPSSPNFGFVYRDWHERMLPFGTAPTESYTVPGCSSPSGAPSTKTVFTPDEVALMQDLFARAVFTYITELLDHPTNISMLQTMRREVAAYFAAHRLDPAMVTTSDISPSMLRLHVRDFTRNYFAMSSATWADQLNATIDEIDIEFVHYELPGNVRFDAVTLQIPFEKGKWQRTLVDVDGMLVDDAITSSLTGAAGNDAAYEIAVANECGTSSCALQRKHTLTPRPKVLAFGDCLTSQLCAQGVVSNSSMLLFATGHRIEADSLKLLDAPSTSSASPNARLRKAVAANLREVHSIVFGRISATVHSISEQFQAQCVAVGQCVGLSYPLEVPNAANKTEWLIVGKESLPIREFGMTFDMNRNVTRGLVLVEAPHSSTFDRSMLRQRNAAQVDWPTPLHGSQCAASIETWLDVTEPQDAHSEHTLQTAYTAGLFFLFQNARPIEQLDVSSSTVVRYGSNAKTLAFLGNEQLVDLVLSISGHLFIAVAIGWYVPPSIAYLMH